MKKILSFFLSLTVVTVGIYAQDIDMSQVSLNPSDRTKPYLGREIVDTIGTCQAVRAELETILEQGASAFSTSDTYGYNHFARNFSEAIETETESLLENYIPEIKEQAVIEAENEYQSILAEATNITQDKILLYYEPHDMGTVYEATQALRRLIPAVLEKIREKWCINMHVRVTGIPKMDKLSKALQKELPKNKAKVIEYLVPIVETEIMASKKDELHNEAFNHVFRNFIRQVLDRMPSVGLPECYTYIHHWGTSSDEREYSIPNLSLYYFRDRDVFKTDKKKIITWKNPNYFKEDTSWAWLSEEEKDANGNVIKRERVEKHFPIEDSYLVDRRHPEFQIRKMYVQTQYGREVNAAFVGDTLKGVSNEFAYANGYVDKEMEQVLCFYELEHNKHNINTHPSYVKDCIRYDLVTFRYSNESYSYNMSYDYKKSHKPETRELSEQYIMQLHLDHKDLGNNPTSFYHKIEKFEYKRTERIDGVTFRHYIGKNEQIVILQKFVYGNYCWKLFPYSKVTTFNPQDYVIDKDVYKPENKVLTCYYVVEKYE